MLHASAHLQRSICKPCPHTSSFARSSVPFRSALGRRVGRIVRALPESGSERGERPDKPPQPSPGNSEDGAKPKAAAGQSLSEAEQVDETMANIWAQAKKEMKSKMSPDEAQLLDELEVGDILDTGKLFNNLAQQKLGPILVQLGVEEDPGEFLFDLLKLATALQLITCGATFYGLELGAHFNAGDAFRCTTGLALGYMTRPFYNVEQLLWPVYQAAAKLISPSATYEITSSTPAEAQASLNRLGITVACGFFIPQLLWGWDTTQCAELMGPVAAGWFLFDVAYFVALVGKLGLWNR